MADKFMSSQLLELVASIGAAIEDGDLVGHVRAWLDVAEGRVNGSDRYCLQGVVSSRTDERRTVAIRLVTHRGWLVSSDLAGACGVSTETARQDLVALAQAGVLQRHGQARGSFYTRADGNGADGHGWPV